MVFAFGWIDSIFIYAISDIPKLVCEKYVIRIYADWIVATVSRNLAFWD